MTIQISVTVWTIICFLLLSVILKKLLFEPVLALLDKRNARIKSAEEKIKQHAIIESEHKLELEKQRELLLSNQKKQIKEKVEQIRSDSKTAIEQAKDKRLGDVEDFRLKTDTEKTEILYELSAHTTELAKLFADRLIEG